MEMLQSMMIQSLEGACKGELIKYDLLSWVQNHSENAFYTNGSGVL